LEFESLLSLTSNFSADLKISSDSPKFINLEKELPVGKRGSEKSNLFLNPMGYFN